MEDSQFIYLPETLVSEHTCRPIFKTTISESPVFWCETCKAYMESPVNAITHLSGKQHKKKLAAKNFTSQELAAEDFTSQKLAAKDFTSPRKLAAKEFTPQKLAAKDFTSRKLAAEDLTSRKLAAEDFTSRKLAAKDFTSQKLAAKDIKFQKSDEVSTSSNQEPLLKKPKYDGRCEVCKIEFTSDIHAEQHFNGKKHAGRLLEVSAGKDVQNIIGSESSDKPNDSSNGVEKKPLECEACKITFTSDVHALQHFKGKRHSETVAAQYNRSEANRQGGGITNRGGRGMHRGAGLIGRGYDGAQGRGYSRGRGNTGMNSNENTGRGRGIGRGERNARGRGRGTSTTPIYDNFSSPNSNGYSNQNIYQNNDRNFGNYHGRTPGGFNDDHRSGSAPISSYSNKMSEISSDINQLKRRLGSLYN